MEVRQYLHVLKRWSLLIIIGSIISGATSFFVSRAQTPIYQASAKLLIMEGELTSPNEFTAIQASERRAESYMARLKNREVLIQATQRIGVNLNPDDLEEAILVTRINNSQLLVINVEHPSPIIAAALANEIPAVFSERNLAQQQDRFSNSKLNLEIELGKLQEELSKYENDLEVAKNNGNDQSDIEQLSNTVLRLRDTHSQLLQSYENLRLAEAQSLSNILIDEPAIPPNEPIRPRIFTNTLLAIVVGMMLIFGIIFLLEYLDDTAKDPKQIESLIGLSTIGVLNKFDNKAENGLVMLNDPRSPAAESYRQLRTNVEFVKISRQVKTILISSTSASEGKSTISANLAIALAQSGKKVILVDADLRRPTLHKYFGKANSSGLTDLLLRSDNGKHLIQETTVPNLKFVPSGPIPVTPAELVGSERMKDVVHWLSEMVDYILLDSPPSMVVTDPCLLSQIADTTIMVVDANKTRYSALAAGCNKIQSVGGHIAGITLNKMNMQQKEYYYYYESFDLSAPSSKKKNPIKLIPQYLSKSFLSTSK